MDNVDRCCRIDARAHRPQNFFLIGRIDVVVDRDVISFHVAVAKARRGNQSLLGMAGVALAQGDDREQAIVKPHTPATSVMPERSRCSHRCT